MFKSTFIALVLILNSSLVMANRDSGIFAVASCYSEATGKVIEPDFAKGMFGFSNITLKKSPRSKDKYFAISGITGHGVSFSEIVNESIFSKPRAQEIITIRHHWLNQIGSAKEFEIIYQSANGKELNKADTFKCVSKYN